MMVVGQSYRYNHVSETQIDVLINETGDMKLFQSYFTAFFNLCFIFAVLFKPFNFASRSRTSVFKFDFGTQYPFGGEFIIKG